MSMAAAHSVHTSTLVSNVQSSVTVMMVQFIAFINTYTNPANVICIIPASSIHVQQYTLAPIMQVVGLHVCSDCVHVCVW